MTNILVILFWLGAALYFPAYVWAFVLAWRVSGGWFVGMLLFGYLLYPLLAYRHWALMRRNAFAFGGGLALMVAAIIMLGTFPH